MPADSRTSMSHRLIETNGIRLHCVEAGPPSGELVILLHGFPEFWFGWRHQIEALARAGYRVLAPDQRGYNLSDKPAGVASYGLVDLADDVAGLVHALGHEQATIVGHDWGGAVAWSVASRHAHLVERLVVLNAPHYGLMKRLLRSNRRQLFKSYYMFYFQLPFLPESTLSAARFAILKRQMIGTARAGTFDPGELTQYEEAWRQPDALASMINWYRASLRQPPPDAEPTRIAMPTKLIWGERDRFLQRELAEACLALCDHGDATYVSQAGHWVQHEEPELVNQQLLSFLAATRTKKPTAFGY